MGPLEDLSPQGVITALPSPYQLGVSNVATRTTRAGTFNPAHCKPANPSPQGEAWAQCPASPGPSPYLAVLGQRVHCKQFPKPELIPTIRVGRPWMALQLTLKPGDRQTVAHLPGPSLAPIPSRRRSRDLLLLGHTRASAQAGCSHHAAPALML